MGLLDKLKGKRGGGDDDDLDELDEESLEDEGSSPGLLGRMRRKINLSGRDDDDGDGDDLENPLDEDDGGSSGIFGRMRRKLKRDKDDEDEDEDEGGDPLPIPVTVTSPPAGAAIAAFDGETQPAEEQGGGQTTEASPEPATQEGTPTPVYIVDTPDGESAAPVATDEPEGEDAQEKDAAPDAGTEGGSGGDGGSGLDLTGLFESEKEVDEAFQDLVDSVEEISASDLATQLQEIMASLNKGG